MRMLSLLATAGLSLASLSPAAAQVWEVSNRLLAAPAPDAGAEFGRTLAVGDFDADGIDDLAIAAPETDLGGFSAVGVVHVLLGDGRSFTTRSVFSPVGPADDLRIGFALAAGNFDETPQDELVLAVVGASDGGVRAGKVTVAYFSTTTPSIGFQTFGQSDIPFPAGGDAGEGDLFGFALAIGDFDGDGFGDLAVGAPNVDNAGTTALAGKVYAFYGSENDLRVDSSSQGFFAPGPQIGGRYGSALSAGDFDGDGFDDLAIGEPGRTLSAQAGAGRVEIVFGSDSGLDLSRNQLLDQSSFGFTLEAGDEFGGVLAAGDFDGAAPLSCLLDVVPCADDLAIGAPLEDVGAAVDAGFVTVAFGVEDVGLTTAGAQAIDQSDLGFNVESGDRFGASLSAANLDGERGTGLPFAATDLLIGVPFEDVAGGQIDQGVVHLLQGVSGSGLALAGGGIQQQFAGYHSAPGAIGDRFGWAAVAGDFDDDGESDLAVGIPLREAGPLVDAGAVQVLYGALFADGFERGTAEGWSAVGLDVE